MDEMKYFDENNNEIEPREIHKLKGKKVYSIYGNYIGRKEGEYFPLKIMFEGGGELVVDAGTFMHPDEPHAHVLGRHVTDIIKRVSHCIKKED